MIEGDGREGFPEYAPYKAIHVGAASPNVPDEVFLHFYLLYSRVLCHVIIYLR